GFPQSDLVVPRRSCKLSAIGTESHCCYAPGVSKRFAERLARVCVPQPSAVIFLICRQNQSTIGAEQPQGDWPLVWQRLFHLFAGWYLPEPGSFIGAARHHPCAVRAESGGNDLVLMLQAFTDRFPAWFPQLPGRVGHGEDERTGGVKG